jgi:hypothetical protein
VGREQVEREHHSDHIENRQFQVEQLARLERDQWVQERHNEFVQRGRVKGEHRFVQTKCFGFT